MNQQIKEYLSSLDLPRPLEERVLEIAGAFKFLCGSEVERLFLSDACDKEGREFVSVWGFAGPYWMEARNFLNEDDIDVSTYWDDIMYLGVSSEKLVMPGPATPDSRMSIEVETSKVNYSIITATGENCNELISIVRGLLLPNLLMGRSEGVES